MNAELRIKDLRLGLRWASPARRAEIERQIAALEAEQATTPNSKRVATVDPERKPPEAQADGMAVDGAGNSSEVKTRQRAAAAPLPSGPVEVSRADAEAATAEAGGIPAPSAFPLNTRSLAEVGMLPPRCSLAGCRRLAKIGKDGKPRKFCSNEHAAEAASIAREGKERKALTASRVVADNAVCALEGCPLPARAAISGRATYCSVEHAHEAKRRRQARAIAERRGRALASPAEAETRREPSRPPYRLTIDRRVVFRPPADLIPPTRYADSGLPTPFQIDLWADLDHGSPGRLDAPEIGQARRSVLAGL